MISVVLPPAFRCTNETFELCRISIFKHLCLYLLKILIFLMTILQQSSWKAGLVLKAFLASLPNQFCCPALVWKEQTVTVYSIISQIPGASNTCYTLLESVKSMLSSANSYLFIFNFLIHEVQLPFLYNSDCTSACLLWPVVIQISNRLVLHQMKTQKEIFQKYQCS